MEKRKILIGDYNTAAHGWTLAAWRLSAAEQKTKYLDKPNGDGAWDVSTTTTDGIPKYNDRKLTVTLETSEGTRAEREATIRQMINLLDGMRWEIRLPDDDHHYLTGRVHVAREYNDLAHAAVTVTAVCEPWKYSNAETVVTLIATGTKQLITLYNGGRRAVVPNLAVDGSSVLLERGESSTAMSTGNYMWPGLLLTPGSHPLTYSGSGTITISYREAVLE